MIRVNEIRSNHWNDYIYNTLDAISLYGNAPKFDPSETMPTHGLDMVFACRAINRLTITPQQPVSQRIILDACDEYFRETFSFIQQEMDRELWGMKIAQYELDTYTKFRPLFHYHLLIFATDGKRIRRKPRLFELMTERRQDMNAILEMRIAEVEHRHLMRSANDSALPVSKRSRI